MNPDHAGEAAVALLPKGDAALAQAQEAYSQGRWQDALTLLESHEASWYLASPDYLKGLLLFGRIHCDQGNFEEASHYLVRAEQVAKQQGDIEAEIDALNLQAATLDAKGDSQHALSCLQRALDLCLSHGFKTKQANVMNNLGLLYEAYGDHHKAVMCLTEAYNLLQTLNPESKDSAVNLMNLGSLYSDIGDITAAESFYERALDLTRVLDHQSLEAVALNNLANLHQRQSKWQSALELANRALLLSRSLELKHYEIDNLDSLGRSYAALQAFDKALEVHQQALSTARVIGHTEGEKEALINLGRDHLALNAPDKAVTYLLDALDIAELTNYRKSQLEVHELLSSGYQRLGDFVKALHHYQLFHQIERSLFNEETEEKTRRLTVKFDLERAKHEAEQYKLTSSLAQQAKLKAEEIVQERTRELEEAQLEIVTRLAVAAEYRDDDTGEHTRRVGRTAAAIAYVLGWSLDEVQLIYIAARLHDVGKIGIRDAILLKPGKLTEDEFDIMRSHAAIGARILSNGRSKLLQLAEEIALAHHERWDGRGYPYGLAGTAIPESARIVAVADVLDALIHERPYKQAWSVDDALSEIKRQSGTQFDPRIVSACMTIFEKQRLSPYTAPLDWQSTKEELLGLFSLIID